MQLRFPVVVPRASLPHTVIRSTVGPLDVEHKILNEIHLVVSVNDL